MNKALLIVPFVAVSLFSGIWAGWIRIGFDIPVSEVALHHGSLMVNGFLASLIFLERAVTFKTKKVLVLPFLNVIAVLPVCFEVPYASYLHLVCSAGFVLLCIYFIKQYKELYYYVFFAGALCLLAGNIVLYQTHMYPAAIVWWIQFLLFTIVAERLELTRFLPLNTTKKVMLIASLILLFISALLPFHNYGSYLFALALAAVGAWLMKFDMAFKSIRIGGQHRYSGLLLITGYVWLFVTAALFTCWTNFSFGYDAVLHSFFIGFVFSMIFSHAPIILPAILKIPVKVFRSWLYVFFAFLQLTLIARIVADLIENVIVRKLSGLVNGVVILLFFVSIATIVTTELRKKKLKS